MAETERLEAFGQGLFQIISVSFSLNAAANASAIVEHGHNRTNDIGLSPPARSHRSLRRFHQYRRARFRLVGEHIFSFTPL